MVCRCTSITIDNHVVKTGSLVFDLFWIFKDSMAGELERREATNDSAWKIRQRLTSSFPPKSATSAIDQRPTPHKHNNIRHREATTRDDDDPSMEISHHFRRYGS
jgi:hypothetical protein